MTYKYAIKLGLTAILLTSTLLSACTVVKTQTDTTTNHVEPLTLSYQEGQLFSIISIDPKDGEEAKAALDEYYAKAFPLANQYGLQRDGQLSVKAVPVGDHPAEGVVFFSWPDAASEAKLNARPEWPDIKKLRPQAWDDLRIYTDEIETDTTLTFYPHKTYTMAVAWINPNNPDHYDIYMEGIQDAVAQSGGRFIYKMFNPTFESHALNASAPGQVTLVEWDSPEGLQKFGTTEGFKKNAKYLSSGVTRFEISVLATQ